MPKESEPDELIRCAPGSSIPPVSDIRELPLDRIRPSPYQGRSNIEDNVGDLLDSIAVCGLLQPIIVVVSPDGFFELVSGERRLAAAKKAGLATITALVLDLGDEQRFRAHIHENEQRLDTTPLDRARTYRAAMARLGYSQNQLASKIGRTESYVSETLSLLTLSAEINARLEETSAAEVIDDDSGSVQRRPLPYSIGVELARLPDAHAAEQRAIFEKWDRHGLSRREVRELVRLVSSDTLAKMPEELQSLTLSHPGMTAELAQFLRAPHEDDDFPQGEDMRRRVARLPDSDLARIARHVAKRGLTKQQTQEYLLNQLDENNAASSSPADLVEVLQTVHQELSKERDGGLALLAKEDWFPELRQALGKVYEVSNELLADLAAADEPVSPQKENT